MAALTNTTQKSDDTDLPEAGTVGRFEDGIDAIVQCRPALPHERSQALALLCQHRSPQSRESCFRWARRLPANSHRPFSGLYVSTRDRRVQGAVWGRVLPGRQASIWLPEIASGEPDDTSARLLAALDAHLADSIANFAYASQASDKHVPLGLAELKFKYVTEMGRMGCPLASEHEGPPSSVLQFVPYQATQSARMKRLLERTNQDSLDCPAVRGARHVNDVLEGHLHREGLVPVHWQIILHQGRDVGCVLVSQHKARQECEVVYLGLVPEARGNGWGQDTIRHAQYLARCSGATKLSLGCDLNNTPALRTYLRAGFREYERSSIFAKQYGGSRGSRT